jgi:hypothetical protein
MNKMINKSKRNIRKSKKKSKNKNISKKHKKSKRNIRKSKKKYDSVGTKRKSEEISNTEPIPIPNSQILSPTSFAIFNELMSSPLSLSALSPLPSSPLPSSPLPSPIFSIPPSPFYENNYDKLDDELDKLYDEYIKVKNDSISSEKDINEAYRKYKSLNYRLKVKPRLVYTNRTVPLLQEVAKKRKRKGGRFVKT